MLLLAAIIFSLIDQEFFLLLFTHANDWILEHFDWLYNYTSFIMVVLCLIIFLSPLAKTKIGGEDAQPLLSRWRWFSIVICTTIAVGILFWGTSEPLFHLTTPPENVEPSIPFTMSSVFVHWSFTPYAIYAIPALLFALGFYNYKMKYSLSAMLFPMGITRSINAMKIVDAICLFALVAGMAAVIGVGMLSIYGGLDSDYDAKKPFVLFIIGLVMVVTFTISAATGLLKGIRILSSINMVIFLVIAGIVLFLGPTRFIFSGFLSGIASMVINFVPQNLGMAPYDDADWMHSWSSFYWANWMAWAPITAMFLGRISYGYTIRQFLITNWIIPAVFGIIWMSIFGGASLFFELNTSNDLISVLQNKGPDWVIYAVFDVLPYTRILAALFLITIFLSFVTAADSNTEAMASISTEGLSAESASPPIFLKFLWGITIGVVGWIMVSYAGADGVKMLSNIGGFPALLLMVVLCIATVILLINQKKLNLSNK